MLNDETTRFLEGGCSLVVGMVTADGHPYATRAWGLEVVAAGRSVRMLIDAEEAADAARLAPGAALAVTAADVRTLYSVQLKGEAVSVEPLADHDRARAERFMDEFFGAIAAVDHMERAVVGRMVPAALAACTFRVTEAFDQTPGPGAGARLSPTRT